MMYKAVVFDFDGTIIDTEKHLFEIINKHLNQYDLQEITLDFYRQSIGGAATELHEYLEEQLGLARKQMIYEEHNKTSKYLPIVADMHELMKYCKQRHIPMAIATSSYRKDIMPTFEQLELETFIDVVVGREDVEDIKPNPDPYLTAVQHLNYNPVNCLAIEDSVNGATAAIRAGLDVIVNTNEMTQFQDFSEISYVGKDLTADKIIASFFEKGGK
ncbi:phosphatase phosphohexomutase [Staphylococcus caeli]|uniref:Phosphatase phosphohexomutase n=2 Tax=Staphylococcus caeli TaxID=2201815 RepID=A0A1D4KWK5_9STAP|nr:phosphatase phosphohexomutase [Staphylococcus caeli]SCS78378.1 phosphatase phosphohexomutase [Staphylococcus caeli]